MTKDPQAYQTIGEAAKTLSVPTHVLRFWETKFPKLKPRKGAGGRRYYRPHDITILREIKRLLHDEGYTLKGAQKYLGVHPISGPLSPPPAPARTPTSAPAPNTGDLAGLIDQARRHLTKAKQHVG